MSTRTSRSFRLTEETVAKLDTLVAHYQKKVDATLPIGFKMTRTKIIELMIDNEIENIKEENTEE